MRCPLCWQPVSEAGAPRAFGRPLHRACVLRAQRGAVLAAGMGARALGAALERRHPEMFAAAKTIYTAGRALRAAREET